MLIIAILVMQGCVSGNINEKMFSKGPLVFDRENNLIWQKCSLGLSGEGCEKGKALRFNWQDAMAVAIRNDNHGYSDWRLPTKAELASLIQEGSQPMISQDMFPATISYPYWSSSVESEKSAWNVYFRYGAVFYNPKHNKLFIRLVRNNI